MANNELQELSDRELLERLADGKAELFNLRFQLATGQLTDYKRIGLVRKEIARIMTARRELEIRAAEALSAGGK